MMSHPFDIVSPIYRFSIIRFQYFMTPSKNPVILGRHVFA